MILLPLSKQCFVYSISTDNFYTGEENKIHDKMVKIYEELSKSGYYEDKKPPNKKNKNFKATLELDEEEISDRKKELSRLKSELTDCLNKERPRDFVRSLDKNAIKQYNVISLFESSLTRAFNIQTGELTEDIFVLSVYFFQVFHDLVRNGFMYNGERYIFFTASAGQIRTKKAVFVKESAYNKVKNKLMCGLTIEKINEKGGINCNKFLAYLALNNSATEIWEDFDINRAIVVDDFETAVSGEVDFINEKYEITRQNSETVIPHMDGAGIMLCKPARMIRLPFIKGAMFYFPFDQFIREKCPDGKCVVKDIYGMEHDIIGENIQYILTKSQFKLHAYYEDWNEYKDNFKRFGCEACYCNAEAEYVPKARINYQMLQTLSDMKDGEIDRLIGRSAKEIESIGDDFQTTMRLLGATNYNQHPSYFQEALQICPELMRDPYCRQIIKQTKISLVKQAKAGRLRVNGRYRFISPDLYAFCEWLFLGEKQPNGLLADGEVFQRDFKDGEEVACLRSPHLYREWAIRKNKRTEETERWFGENACVYTSTHDLISRILQFDKLSQSNQIEIFGYKIG